MMTLAMMKVLFGVLATTVGLVYVYWKLVSVKQAYSAPLVIIIQNTTTSENLTSTANGSASGTECGKICSYDYDWKQEEHQTAVEAAANGNGNGGSYPLLRKRVNCRNLMLRMAHPPFRVVRPAPRQPPPDLVNDYSQNGRCPIGFYGIHFDETNLTTSTTFGAGNFRGLIALDQLGKNINPYGGTDALKRTLQRHVSHIRGRHVAVVGTQKPWAEAMLVNRHAGKVTTIEYASIRIEHYRVATVTPYKLAEQLLEKSASGNGDNSSSSFEVFDSAFSYSSIEHTGLGRYGDPLMPFGDMEAVAQIWCMLKPGGLFFLAVPVSSNRIRCFYQWNAHRIYGAVRLQHLTANWRVIESVDMLDSYHVLYVLQKLDDSF